MSANEKSYDRFSSHQIRAVCMRLDKYRVAFTKTPAGTDVKRDGRKLLRNSSIKAVRAYECGQS